MKKNIKRISKKINKKKSKRKVSKKVIKRKTKRKNPYSKLGILYGDENDNAIAYYSLFNDQTDPSGHLHDLIMNKIYADYYYKNDIKKMKDHYSIDEFVKMINKHKTEYYNEMSTDDIEDLVSFIKELKLLPDRLVILMPPEFGFPPSGYDNGLSSFPL